MKAKRIAVSLLILALVLGLALPAVADKASIDEWAKTQAEALPEDQRAVNVFTWTYYIPDEVVAEFENATGIRINYSPFMDNDDVVAKLQSNPGQYDIVVISDYVIADLVKEDLLAEIAFDQIPNSANIDAGYQGQYFDPDNLYTIPYTNTIPLIIYDPTKVDFEVKGFADLWRPEFEGGLAMIAEMRNLIGIAQKKQGMSFNEIDESKAAVLLDDMKALKKNIMVMNDDTPHNALISGDAIAGYMYGSQIVAAREVLPDLKVVYPEEGVNFGIDCLVVPKDAPHADAANIFLNYLLDGEISAMASELINYGNCNTAAPEFMSEAFKAEDSVNVPASVIETAEAIYPASNEELDLYSGIWTEFMQS